MEYNVPLRIVIVNPDPDRSFFLEDDEGNISQVTESTGDNITFDFYTIVKPNRRTSKPNFNGPFARGTPSKRFFYVSIGATGTEKPKMEARGKFWISGSPKSVEPPKEVTWDIVKEVASDPSKVLMARCSRRGGLLDGGWVVAQR